MVAPSPSHPNAEQAQCCLTPGFKFKQEPTIFITQPQAFLVQTNKKNFSKKKKKKLLTLCLL